MRNEFEVAFNEIAELRSLPRDVVLEALQTALVSAYRRDAGASSAQLVEANVDPTTGRARIFVEKEVVDDVMNPNTEVTLEKARYYDPECEYGDMVMVQVEGTTKKFGRIAAQTAKQVILQKIREAERNSLYDEFSEREGDLVTGTVQSINQSFVTLSLGRAEAMMPRAQQIPGERFKPHDKVRVYVLEVKRTNRGPQIIVSRSHRFMLRRLLEYEVPEIYNNQVEIKNIAREAGYRSKVAVAALQDGIDPVGACVGMRGIRIQNIVKELHDEKIDVIEWNPNQEQFISKALSPARVTGVYLDDDPDHGRTAVVIVPDDQLSLAIGREGQNARLAAKLTGWRIDIKSVAEAVESALEMLDSPPLAEANLATEAELAHINGIMQKRHDSLTVMPEEYNTLAQFADKVEQHLLGLRLVARRKRMEEINAVKATLPQGAFSMSIDELELPSPIIEALEPLENVGEIMLRFLIDEKRIKQLLSDFPDNALLQIQEALDQVVFPDVIEEEIAPTEAAPVDDEALEAGHEVLEAEAVATEAIESDEVEVDELPIPTAMDVPPIAEPAPAKARPVEFDEEVLEFDEDEDDEFLGSSGKSNRKKKKERQKRRQLIFDERSGQVVAKRRRKGSRKRDKWDDEIDY